MCSKKILAVIGVNTVKAKGTNRLINNNNPQITSNDFSTTNK